jgi:hypothetical protein
LLEDEEVEKRDHTSEDNKSDYTPNVLLWCVWREVKPDDAGIVAPPIAHIGLPMLVLPISEGSGSAGPRSFFRAGGADDSLSSRACWGARRGFRRVVDGRHAGQGEL